LRRRRQDIKQIAWRQFAADVMPGPKASERLLAYLERATPSARSDAIERLMQAEIDLGVAPAIDHGHSVIVDSYWYKIAAREELLGKSTPDLTVRLRRLAAPEAVIILATSVEIARRRKAVLSPFEHPGDPDQFEPFQTEVQRRIHQLVESVAHFVIVGDRPVLDVVDEVAGLLGWLVPGAVAQRYGNAPASALAVSPSATDRRLESCMHL
jgi:thymidylate kinase